MRHDTFNLWAPIAIIVLLVAAMQLPGESRDERPRRARNVILIVGDGMGLEQVEAAGLWHEGVPGRLSFEQLPHRAIVETRSVTEGEPTDSAAAATALATGFKVTNGVVSLDIPRTGDPLKTIAERFKDDGRAVGLVTNDGIVGATPAAFFAHVPIRNMYLQIARQIIETARPDVMLGAGDSVLSPTVAEAYGYLATGDPTQLESTTQRAVEEDRPLAGVFAGDRFTYRHHDTLDDDPRYGRVYPTLAQMTDSALRVLQKRGGERGFFLVIEGALIDKSGHAERVRETADDRLAVNTAEVIELHEAVKVAVEFARANPDTLVIVTADHETGGLSVVEPRGKGELPRATWAHTDHTGVPVGAWAMGPGAGRVAGRLDNTDLHAIMLDAAGLTPPPTSTQSAATTGNADDDKPRVARNVILFIGDGMGPAQVDAGGLYHDGEKGKLSFQAFPHHAEVRTDSTRTDGPTDSAAAATAISTGYKVNNSVIALDIPRTGKPLTTVAESFKADGRAIGVVTTDGVIGATPASFLAHVPVRNMGAPIAQQILRDSRPDVMMGAADKVLTPEHTAASGYLSTGDPKKLDEYADRAIKEGKPLAAMFPGDRFTYRYHDTLGDNPKYGDVYPTLPQMTEAALRVLEHRGGERGFFLLVESALIDKSGHNQRLIDDKSDTERLCVNANEVIQLHDAVKVAIEFARNHPDTLVLVTADHETGGLAIVEPGAKGEPSKVTWAHNSHTRANVGAWAMGPGAERVKGTLENTDLYHVMMKAASLKPSRPE